MYSYQGVSYNLPDRLRATSLDVYIHIHLRRSFIVHPSISIVHQNKKEGSHQAPS